MASPFLTALFGQQAASNLDPQTEYQGQIDVTAPAPMEPPAYEDPYVDFLIGNRRAIEETNAARNEMKEASDRRGMFGVKGTLRDVLGKLGDAFLVQGGRDALYGPTRRREQMSDALAGFSKRPIEAAERATSLDPEFGQQLYDKYLGQKSQDTQDMIAANNATTRSQDLAYQQTKQGRAEASQAIAGALAVGTPEALAYAEQLAMNAARAYNTTPEALGFTPGMTPEEARVFAGRSATTNQNLREPLDRRRVAVQEGNLDARRQAVSIAARRLGLDERKFQEAVENNDWDAMLDLFDLDIDNRNAQNSGRRNRRGNRGQQAPTPAPQQTRPRSNW